MCVFKAGKEAERQKRPDPKRPSGQSDGGTEALYVGERCVTSVLSGSH